MFGFKMHRLKYVAFSIGFLPVYLHQSGFLSASILSCSLWLYSGSEKRLYVNCCSEGLLIFWCAPYLDMLLFSVSYWAKLFRF